MEVDAAAGVPQGSQIGTILRCLAWPLCKDKDDETSWQLQAYVDLVSSFTLCTLPAFDVEVKTEDATESKTLRRRRWQSTRRQTAVETEEATEVKAEAKCEEEEAKTLRRRRWQNKGRDTDVKTEEAKEAKTEEAKTTEARTEEAIVEAT